MEFFRIVGIHTSEQIIQEEMILEKLEEITNELVLLDQIDDASANIGGIWGEFTLERSTIKECPNALAWTITTGYPPAIDSIVIHLTLNRTEKSKDFIEEVEEFLDDHCERLKKFFAERNNLSIIL